MDMLGHSGEFKIQQGFQNVSGKYHPSVDCFIGWYDWDTGETRGKADRYNKQRRQQRSRDYTGDLGNAKYVVAAPHFR